MINMLYFGISRLWAIDLRFLCGASLFGWRTTSALRRRCGRTRRRKRRRTSCRLGTDALLKSWSTPSGSSQADGGEQLSDQALALATHCARTDRADRSLSQLTATFFPPLFVLISLAAFLLGRRDHASLYRLWQIRTEVWHPDKAAAPWLSPPHLLMCGRWLMRQNHLRLKVWQFTEGDKVEREHKKKWNPTFTHANFQEPSTAPLSPPSSRHHSLLKAWLVECENVAVCCLSTSAICCALQWWSPETPQPTAITWLTEWDRSNLPNMWHLLFWGQDELRCWLRTEQSGFTVKCLTSRIMLGWLGTRRPVSSCCSVKQTAAYKNVFIKQLMFIHRTDVARVRCVWALVIFHIERTTGFSRHRLHHLSLIQLIAPWSALLIMGGGGNGFKDLDPAAISDPGVVGENT